MRNLLKNKALMGLMLLLIAAICLLPLPKQMNITQVGVLWQGGASRAAQTTQVTIQGTYYDYLLRADDFKGRIQVEALPETHGNMSITRLERDQYGIWVETKDALLRSFGGMFLRKDGSILISIHDDGHWGADSGRMLTAPASTREEAVALTNELARELSPNWLGTWTFE